MFYCYWLAAVLKGIPPCKVGTGGRKASVYDACFLFEIFLKKVLTYCTRLWYYLTVPKRYDKMNGGTKAMTNYEIIEKAKVALIMNGAIEAEDEIHTFQGWKERGFKVRKGEHAIAMFSIWKYTSKVVATKDDGTELTKDSCFLKDSCWFSTKQVETMA